MNRRFFSEHPIGGDAAQLDGAEAEHLVRVLRGKVGDQVTLFDGRGAEYSARITAVRRSRVELAVLARHLTCRELSAELVLGVALPKGERQRWLVEKAVELGVTRLVPLVTQRSVAEPVAAVARLRRYVIEASKQCGRNRLLEIATPVSWAVYCGQDHGTATRLVAAFGPQAAPLSQAFSRATGGGVWLAVGPEGGLTDDELAAAASWRRVSLGSRVLRVETAALALVAFCSLHDAAPVTPGNGLDE